ARGTALAGTRVARTRRRPYRTRQDRPDLPTPRAGRRRRAAGGSTPGRTTVGTGTGPATAFPLAAGRVDRIAAVSRRPPVHRRRRRSAAGGCASAAGSRLGRVRGGART